MSAIRKAGKAVGKGLMKTSLGDPGRAARSLNIGNPEKRKAIKASNAAFRANSKKLAKTSRAQIKATKAAKKRSK